MRLVKTLVIIDSDPRTSPRPAEAVRIAAGIGPWDHAVVTLYLGGPAVAALDEFPDELMDGRLFATHLPHIVAHGGPVLVEAGCELPTMMSIEAVEAISREELAQRVAETDDVLRF